MHLRYSHWGRMLMGEEYLEREGWSGWVSFSLLSGSILPLPSGF